MTRPRQPKFPDTFEVDGIVWHNKPSAASLLGVGPRQLMNRHLDHENFRGILWWREPDLLAARDTDQLAAAERRELARKNRAKGGRNRVVHDRWVDEHGVKQPLTRHPSYDAVVRVVELCDLDVAQGFPDRLCKDWRTASRWHCEQCAVAYETEAVIGPQPGRRWYLQTVLPDQSFSGDTVLWWPSPWGSTSKARWALESAAAAGDSAAIAAKEVLAKSDWELIRDRQCLAREQRAAAERRRSEEWRDPYGVLDGVLASRVLDLDL